MHFDDNVLLSLHFPVSFFLLHISVFLSIIWLFSPFSSSFLATAFIHFTDRQLETTVDRSMYIHIVHVYLYFIVIGCQISLYCSVARCIFFTLETKWLISIDGYYLFFLQNVKNREIDSKDAHKMKYPSHLVRRLIMNSQRPVQYLMSINSTLS